MRLKATGRRAGAATMPRVGICTKRPVPRMVGFCVTVALCMSVAFGITRGRAQTAAADNSAIYLYQGADRSERLIAKAREEGTLTFYTSMATTESGPLAQAFEKKYGAKVQLWRALSENVLQRALTEARGGRANLWVVGYNTGKVKREELPAMLEGFADPRWKGRLALEATESDWMYGVVSFMGEARGLEFFRKLAALKPEMRKGHVLVAQLVAAGELPLCLTIYSGNAVSIKAKGGPIDWAAVEPLVGRPQAIAVAANAPHPHAALLFADFVLSPEGQKLLGDMGRVPSSRTQKTLLDAHKHVMVDPIKSLAEAPKWEGLWNELFLK